MRSQPAKEIANGASEIFFIFRKTKEPALAGSQSVDIKSFDWNTFENTVRKWADVFESLNLCPR